MFMLFCKCFFSSCTVLSENVAYITSSKYFFMCKRNLKHSYVKCVKNILRKKHRIPKHLQIKHKLILVLGQRYQDSTHLLQNPKVPKNVMGFNIHTQRFTGFNYMDVENPLVLSSVL